MELIIAAEQFWQACHNVPGGCVECCSVLSCMLPAVGPITSHIAQTLDVHGLHGGAGMREWHYACVHVSGEHVALVGLLRRTKAWSSVDADAQMLRCCVSTDCIAESYLVPCVCSLRVMSCVPAA
jgi:hypothetical protein